MFRVRTQIVVLTLSFTLVLTFGCGGEARQAEDTGAVDQRAALPWPEPLCDTWRGTCVARQLLLDSLQTEWTDSVFLTLKTNTFEYGANDSLLGKGTYAVDGAYLVFSYLLMERITKSPLNLEGRFEFVYRDSVLILIQHEAVGPPVRDQIFMEKELTLRRTHE